MNQKNGAKFNNVRQPEQQCQGTQPTRNWLDLPSEITANILNRIGAIDILLRAQKVCTAWRKICKDPSMWRVVHIEYSNANFQLHELCKHVVDKSQGRLVDITFVEFCYVETLLYIANRSSQLKRVTVACCGDYMEDMWTECLKKLPLLEDLSLYGTTISKEAIETAGSYCSMLKTLKVNQDDYRFWDEDSERDSIAMAIGQNLHELRHLELIGNPLSNKGLETILDGCHHLESLDLRRCLFINLNGDLRERCLQQIKCLKLPYVSLKECPYIYKDGCTARDVDDESEEGSGSDEEVDDVADIESDDDIDEESDMESYDEADIECDREFDDESDMESDEEADIERDAESDLESYDEADMDCDEEFDDESDDEDGIESDDEADIESDEEFDDESDDG